MLNKLGGLSLDLESANKDKLKSVFPDCFSEETLDIDKLLSLCGEYIDNDFEEYKFEWKGKLECLRLAQKRSTGMEIFDAEELTANLDKDAVAVTNSVYDYVVYDSSTVEKPFAIALDNDPDVKLFFKLPSRFKIETPIGTYNPDWAVYMDKDGSEKMYFAMETKGIADTWNLRTTEQLKIYCGQQHFKALENGTALRVTRSWNEFKLKN